MHPRYHAKRDAGKAAVIIAETGESLSYGDLERRANRGAHALRRLGLRTGDTMACWLPNVLGYFEIYWAAQRAGLFIVPISAAMTDEEAAYILADAGAKLLIVSSAIVATLCLLAAPRPAALTGLLTLGDAIDGQARWEDLVARQPDTPIRDEQAGFHMVYSSGTTGRPKGVRLPLTGGPATAPLTMAGLHATMYGTDEHTVFLSPAPLYHTAPLAFTTTVHRLGGTVVLMKRFSPEAALAAIAEYRVTMVQMVPTMFIRLLRLPEQVRKQHDLSSLRIVVHAAAPCPIDVKLSMIDWLGMIVYEYYGGSEGNGSTFITPEEWLRKPGSVGRANWGTIHVCNDDGDELPAGQDGLIYFEGGWNFRYLNDIEKTMNSRHPLHPSWSTLGDIGHLDEDDYLFLTDRKSFMIISGGVNVYPQESENVLLTHPKVADAAVIGVPDLDKGEAVKAVVQPVDWADATPAFADELIAHCRQHLSPIKTPRTVDFERELPRQETGKLFKRLIRARYWPDQRSRIS